MTIDEKLDEIIKRLERIEQRQITVKGQIEQGAQTQQQGSFGTIDTGEK